MEEEVTIQVCDKIMGSGKTTASINKMKEDVESNYIFITPYLDEVDRIKESCPDRNFTSPQNKGKGKLDNLHNLLGTKRNIASTHALFSVYNSYTIELIRNGNYKLILDEVCNAVEKINISKSDLQLLQRDKCISIEDNDKVRWIKEDYDGKFNELKEKAESGTLLLSKGVFLFWEFPVEVFKCFKEVIVLTYLFDGQVQKYYYDINNVKFDYIGIDKNDKGELVFSKDSQHDFSYVKELKNKIHILDDAKMNLIGENDTALCVSWFEREKGKRNKPLIKELKNNLVNLYRKKMPSSSGTRLWTTYKDYEKLLSGKGYTSCFIPCTIRATNKYKDRTHLAYCVNIYFNPIMKNFFLDRDVKVEEDKYAVSEMVQWIWRSAIREHNEIWIYIPSKRMRNLLINWLEDISK